ncbi:acyltransferase family protein [Pseudarthrobacter sp. NPDC092419]|uniref:acyltransferase family protein n=1 Tax=Pseudarthrobacter sp. NPDC092419 TaxID=3364414 RepID=UPI0037FE924A
MNPSADTAVPRGARTATAAAGFAVGGVEGRGARLNSLTSLRFFAAAAVALMHAFGLYAVPLLNVGFVGVSFFFVLSGFVLTWAGAADNGVGTFFRNRIAKLFPLSAATLAVAALIPVAPNSNGVSFLHSLFLLQAWWPSSAPSFNPVAWSLSAEAFFYLLLPPLVARMRRFSTRELLGAIVFLGVLQPAAGTAFQVILGTQVNTWAAQFFTYNFPPYRILEFIIGVALALLLKSGYAPAHRTQLLVAGLATAGTMLTVLAASAHVGPWWVYQSLMLPAIVALIWTAARREIAGASGLLTSPRLVRLGELSFAFYMVHYLVLGTVGVLVNRWAQGLPWQLALPALISAAGIAWLAHTYIEKPCERALRDKLPRLALPKGEPQRNAGAAVRRRTRS